jgi:solute carrier family 25 (mitochondrial S-adenosylmethionine transporter), member 26
MQHIFPHKRKTLFYLTILSKFFVIATARKSYDQSSCGQRLCAFAPTSQHQEQQPGNLRQRESKMMTDFTAPVIKTAEILPSMNDITRRIETSSSSSIFKSDTEKNQYNYIPNSSSLIPIYQMAFAGAVATVLGDAAIHPMDCIKTLQQSDEGYGLSLWQAATLLWNSGGLYRGLGTYLVTDAMAGAVKFGTYESLKRRAKKLMPSNLLPYCLYLIGGMSFLASSLILCPGEMLKQQLQMGHYTSVTCATIDILHKDGWQGLYHGYQGILMRDVPYTMIELGLYDSIKSTNFLAHVKNPSAAASTNQSSIAQEILAAVITGAVAGFLTTPLDTIKTKLMVDGADGFFHCMEQTVHDHGTFALFAGATARVTWLIPFSAIYLPLFDAIQRRLSAWNLEYASQVSRK